jgi:hypothetical protein
MGLTNPYRQNNYQGEYAAETGTGSVLEWIRSNEWDSTGDGTGSPQEGMFFYDTVADRFKVFANAAWKGIAYTTDPAGAGGSDHQVQFNDGGSLNGAATLYWDHGNSRLGLGTSTPTVDFDVVTASDAARGIKQRNYSATADAPAVLALYRARGTAGTPADINTGDTLGLISISGRSASADYVGAQIGVVADGTTAKKTHVTISTLDGTTFAERMRLTSVGFLGIGTAAPGVPLDVQWNGFTAIRAIAYGAAYATVSVNRANGTMASPTAVTNGNYLGIMQWAGFYNTTTQREGAQITGEAAEGWDASGSGANLLFGTTANRATVVSERMRITQAGHLYIGLTTAPTVSGATVGRRLIASGDATIGGIAAEVAADAARFESYRCGGTLASKTAVASGDQIGSWGTYGWDGGTTPSYIVATQIKGEVDGTVAEDNVPGRLVFMTRNTGGTFAERMRLTSAGYLGIGCTPAIDLDVQSNTYAYIRVYSFGTTVFPTLTMNKANGTQASPSAILSADIIGQLQWGGLYDGANGRVGACIRGVATENWGASASGTMMTFNTTPNATTTHLERMRINQDGKVGIGCTNPGGTLEVFVDSGGGTVIASGASDTPGVNPGLMCVRSRGTRAARTAVQSGDYTGGLYFMGYYDASNAQHAATIISAASVNWSGTDQSAYMAFYTTNVTSWAERMRLIANGSLGIGKTAPTERLDLYDGSGNGAIRVGNTTGTNAGTIRWTGTAFQGYTGSGWTAFGGGSPAGSSTQIQYNNAGAFGADANFTWSNSGRLLNIQGEGGYLNQYMICAAGAGVGYANTSYYRSRGTLATPTALAAGDGIGSIGFLGRGATSSYTAAIIWAGADGTFTDSSSPGYLDFYTTPSGSTSPLQRMRLTSAGYLYVSNNMANAANIVGIPLSVAMNQAYAGVSTQTFGTTYYSYFAGYHANGTLGTPTAAVAGDNLAAFIGGGYGDNTWVYAGRIRVHADGTFTNSSSPGYMSFLTTPSGSTTEVERMRILSGGQVFITNAMASVANHNQNNLVVAMDQAFCGVGVHTFGTGYYSYFSGLHANGSAASRTAAVSGNTLVAHVGAGFGTSTWVTGGRMTVVADGTFSDSSAPGYLTLETTPSGSASPVERVRITSAGQVRIGDVANTASGNNLAITKDSYSSIALESFGNPAYGIFSYMKSRGSSASKTDVAAADVLAELAAVWAYKNADWRKTTQIQVIADAVGTNLVSSYLRFDTMDAAGTLAEKFRIASASQYEPRVSIGAAQTISIGGASYSVPLLVQTEQTNNLPGIAVEAIGASNGASMYFYRARNTVGTKQIVQSGDNCGSLNWGGYDGSTYRPAAAIGVNVDATPGASDMPGNMVFYTTADGAASMTERMRITSAGIVRIGVAGGATGQIDLYGTTSGTVTLKAAAAAGTGTVFQFPTTNGTNGWFLQTSGSGVTSWAAVSATPAGSDHQIQYNNAGAFGGASSFYYIDTATPIASFGSSTGAATLSGTSYTVPLYVAGAVSGTYLPGIHVDGVGTTTTLRMLRANGTLTSKTAVVNTEVVFGIQGWGYDGTDYANAGGIYLEIDGTVSNNNVPGRLTFHAGINDAPSERMRITSAGYVQINTATDPVIEGAAQNRRLVVSGAAGYNSIANESSAGAAYYEFLRCNGTVASKTVVTSGDTIGGFYAYGWNTNTSACYRVSSGVGFEVDAALSGIYVPGRIVFSTMSGAGTFVERMRLTSDNKLRMGAYTPTFDFQLTRVGSAYHAVFGVSNTASDQGTLLVGRARGTSDASPSVVSSGDALGALYFCGYEAGFRGTAWIGAFAAQTWASGANGGHLTFNTTPSDTATSVERVRITDAGVVQIGKAGGVTGRIDLLGTTSGAVTLKVADAAGSWTMTLPAAAPGVTGYVLSATTAGVCSWIAAGGGTTVDAGTAAGQLLFWDNGNTKWTYAETSEWVWDDTNKRVGINVAAPSSRLDVGGDIEVASDAWTYYGDPTTNGSWRTGRTGDDLVVEKRIAGTWTTKHTFA